MQPRKWSIFWGIEGLSFLFLSYCLPPTDDINVYSSIVHSLKRKKMMYSKKYIAREGH